MFAAYNDGPGNLEEKLASGGLLPAETRLYLVNVTASVEGRRGSGRAMAQLTRPNGEPILVDCAQVTKIRAPLPEEYAPSVLSVITIGKARQGALSLAAMQARASEATGRSRASSRVAVSRAVRWRIEIR